MEATSGKRKLLLEVKGLSGKGLTVGLTPNEYDVLRRESDNYRLCVVREALNEPKLLICRYSKESEGWIVEDHDSARIEMRPRTSASVDIRV